MRDLAPHEIISLVDDMKPFLESDGWKFAVSILREDFTNRMIETEPRQHEEREIWYRHLTVLRELETVFNTLIVGAEMHKQRLAYDDAEQE